MNNSFNKSIHTFGILSSVIILVLMYAIPTVMCIVYDVWPDFQALIPTFISVAMILVPYSFAECLAYPPVIGPGTVYMAYITGNTTSLKMPCALTAVDNAQAEKGSDEANAIALVAVGTSSLTVMTILIIGIILATPLSPVLNAPVLQPGFSNIVPSLMGALLGGNIIKSEKYFVTPLIVAVLLVKFTAINAAYCILLVVVASCVAGYFISNMKKPS